MAGVHKLQKDSEELVRLSTLTEVPSVRNILLAEADKLKKIAEQESKIASKVTNSSAMKLDSRVSKITDYGWDQSDKFLKIYVTLNGVQNYPADNVTCSFDKKQFELRVLNESTKLTHVLGIKSLLEEIKPEESHFKVKTDMVVVFLKKVSTSKWAYVTETEKKAKDIKTPKMDNKEDADPSASLMNLMRQMYEDGDDDMKRTIAKAWTESRDKGQSSSAAMDL